MTTEEEIFLLDKWFKETGNAVNAVKKSLNFHLNRLQTDQFIAETAGKQKEMIEAVSEDKHKNLPREIGGDF